MSPAHFNIYKKYYKNIKYTNEAIVMCLCIILVINHTLKYWSNLSLMYVQLKGEIGTPGQCSACQLKSAI